MDQQQVPRSCGSVDSSPRYRLGGASSANLSKRAVRRSADVPAQTAARNCQLAQALEALVEQAASNGGVPPLKDARGQWVTDAKKKADLFATTFVDKCAELPAEPVPKSTCGLPAPCPAFWCYGAGRPGAHLRSWTLKLPPGLTSSQHAFSRSAPRNFPHLWFYLQDACFPQERGQKLGVFIG